MGIVLGITFLLVYTAELRCYESEIILELLNKISIFFINNTLRSGIFASRQ